MDNDSPFFVLFHPPQQDRALREIEGAGRCIQDAGKALTLAVIGQQLDASVQNLTKAQIEELLSSIEASVAVVRRNLYLR